MKQLISSRRGAEPQITSAMSALAWAVLNAGAPESCEAARALATLVLEAKP